MSCIYRKLKWYDEDDCEMICTHCDSEFYGEYPYACENCGLYDSGEEKENWNGYHGHCVAPKSTFQKIWEDEKEGDEK